MAVAVASLARVGSAARDVALGGRQSFDLGNRFSLGTVVRDAGVSKTMRKRRRTPRVTNHVTPGVLRDGDEGEAKTS